MRVALLLRVRRPRVVLLDSAILLRVARPSSLQRLVRLLEVIVLLLILPLRVFLLFKNHLLFSVLHILLLHALVPIVRHLILVLMLALVMHVVNMGDSLNIAPVGVDLTKVELRGRHVKILLHLHLVLMMELGLRLLLLLLLVEFKLMFLLRSGQLGLVDVLLGVVGVGRVNIIR